MVNRGKLVFLVTTVTCNSISKRQDQSLNVRVNYAYQGPALTTTLYAVVTNVGSYDEIGSTKKTVSVNLPNSPTPQSLYTDITGLPLAGCTPQAGYGMKVKAPNLSGAPEWGRQNVLTVTTVPVVYQGTISKKELEYDSARVTIPGYPSGAYHKKGLVHIWGRNDMATSQKMGIWWQVKNPAGTVLETYSTWEAFSTGAGSEHEFIGGRFNFEWIGTYKIDVALKMNSSAPVTVATYTGNMCTVVS